MHAGQHAFAEATRGFNRLAEQDAVFHVSDVPGHTGLFKLCCQARPQGFFGAEFGGFLAGVIVKTATTGAAGALDFLHHFFNEQLARGGHIGLAFSGKVGLGLFHHMHAQRHGGFVNHRQRAHGHAALQAGVFNRGGGDAFRQHGHTFHHESAKHPAGEKAARVVHHNRDLADGLHIVKCAGHGFVVGLFAADDLHQLHFVDRAEEVDADEFLGAG